jgi:hypothetical protein
MAQTVPTSLTRRSMVAGLTLTTAPASALLGGTDNAHAQAKQISPDKSLYDRLGGVFAIAAVVDHFSDAVVKNPIVGQKSKNHSCRNGIPRIWEDCRASSSCGRCGSAAYPVDPSSSRPPSPARLRSALKRRIGTFASRPQNSMRSQRSLDGPWISRKSRSARRTRSWQPLPPTKAR